MKQQSTFSVFPFKLTKNTSNLAALCTKQLWV